VPDDGGVRPITRRRSADHERLWFSLTGYCLRPGFGYPLDEWRVGRLWALYEQGVQHHRDAQVRAEWWTLWRRVAGGLDAAAQLRLSEDLLADLRPLGGKAAKDRLPGIEDMVRLAGVLERLPAARKLELGELLLARLARKGESPQLWWAVGRLATRRRNCGGRWADWRPAFRSMAALMTWCRRQRRRLGWNEC